MGLPTSGKMHEETATPIVLKLLLALEVILKTSSRDAPFSAVAPAILKARINPAIPRLFNFSLLLALAISSETKIVYVSIPSSFTISHAISKFMTSPP